MLLKKIDICNFRQFCGKHTISFGIDGQRKVILIRGQNGSGKTALLNAFWWCFYGDTTDKFKNKSKIVSLKAIASTEINEEITCSVSVVFEHGDNEYEIKRYLKGKTKQRLNFEPNFKKPKIEMKIKNIGTGETRSCDSPQEKVKTILPRELAPYFFFDGENLQHMTEKDKKMDIAKSIRLLTGATLFKRAANDLIGKGAEKGKVKRKFQKDKALYGDDEAKEVEKGLDRANQERDNLIAHLKREQKEKDALNQRLYSVDEKLRNNEMTKQTQRELESIRNIKKQYEDKCNEIEIKKAKLIAGEACFPFLSNAISEVRNIIQNSKKAGLIPQGFKKAWINKLLQVEKCICGEGLVKGSEKYKKVFELIDEKQYDDIDEKIAKLNVRIETYMTNAKNFKSELMNTLSEEKNAIQQLRREKDNEAEALGLLGREANKIVGEDNLKDKKLELETDINKLLENIGKTKYKIEIQDKEIGNLEKESKKQEGLGEKAQLASRRIEIVDNIGKICDKISNYRELNTWRDLQKHIQDIYKEVSIKPFKIELSSPLSDSPYEFRVCIFK